MMKETDMYGAIKKYFEEQGFKVRSEVRDIDVVAEKKDLLVGIEMKKGLTIELLTQAALRQKTCDLVYMAVPKPKRIVKNRNMNNMLYLLKRMELGLLYVDVEKVEILEVQEPAFYDLDRGRRAKMKEKLRILKEMKKRSVDGNKGGSRGKKLLTAYREDSLRAVALIRLKGVVSPKELKELGINHTLLSRNYYDWFIKVDHGKYSLNGVHPDHETYGQLIEHFVNEYRNLAEL
ncbi:DUF2161 family putative PD-(D/E)XK-type phosphodiesterase [Proteiniclasticum sp. C24MP]|uniref:DUF2161 family putative PD-(D/E)XK-type phosphodiesterase n=1 Tax=Proteiniclasticum sp. C24MP TaxID=3374101 RepID=UPI0037552354